MQKKQSIFSILGDCEFWHTFRIENITVLIITQNL